MSTTATVDMQIASDARDLPDEEQLRSWVVSTLLAADAGQKVELSVRLVDEDESRDLNNRYRKKDKATNVLSFPFEDLEGLPGEIIAGTRTDEVTIRPSHPRLIAQSLKHRDQDFDLVAVLFASNTGALLEANNGDISH